MASVAAQTDQNPDTGTNIMVAGLAFQVFSLSVFITLTLEFAWRARRWRAENKEASGSSYGDLGDGGMPLSISKRRLILFSSFFSIAIIGIFTRCVFRVAELSEGWTGPLIQDEVTFIVLEGV